MLSPRQWADWVEYHAIEPWGFDVEDARTALIASTIGRSVGADVNAADFSMRAPPTPEELEEQQHAEMVEEIKRMIGGRHVDEPPRSTPSEKL